MSIHSEQDRLVSEHLVYKLTLILYKLDLKDEHAPFGSYLGAIDRWKYDLGR